jgi:hypothetical protein
MKQVEGGEANVPKTEGYHNVMVEDSHLIDNFILNGACTLAPQ